jgi:tripartite-type tricarboxylate transporter receptor subunit TctC
MRKLQCAGRSLLALAALFALSAAAGADSVSGFYKNRSVSLVIGYSVGGGYDAYGRLLARYIGKHIPGEPSIIPQQMTGAGSLRAANYIFSVAPKDGSVLGTFSRSMGIAPLLGQAEFDSRKFTWLGSVSAATIDALLAEVYTTPKDVLGRATQAISSANQ